MYSQCMPVTQRCTHSEGLKTHTFHHTLPFHFVPGTLVEDQMTTREGKLMSRAKMDMKLRHDAGVCVLFRTPLYEKSETTRGMPMKAATHTHIFWSLRWCGMRLWVVTLNRLLDPSFPRQNKTHRKLYHRWGWLSPRQTCVLSLFCVFSPNTHLRMRESLPWSHADHFIKVHPLFLKQP